MYVRNAKDGFSEECSHVPVRDPFVFRTFEDRTWEGGQYASFRSGYACFDQRSGNGADLSRGFVESEHQCNGVSLVALELLRQSGAVYASYHHDTDDYHRYGELQ